MNVELLLLLQKSQALGNVPDLGISSQIFELLSHLQVLVACHVVVEAHVNVLDIFLVGLGLD